VAEQEKMVMGDVKYQIGWAIRVDDNGLVALLHQRGEYAGEQLLMEMETRTGSMYAHNRNKDARLDDLLFCNRNHTTKGT
jgi:hypothetical protein